jgi:hypothetical protein
MAAVREEIMESVPYTNLTQQRSDADAWAPRGFWSRLGGDRMALSLASIAGLAVGLYGATRRRGDPGMWWLIGTAIGCAAVALATRSRSERPLADLVTQESVDSFPASDAPSSNATTATVGISSRDQ